MDLESGTSVWRLDDRQPQPAYPDLDRNLECDIAVVGAGITGALVAYHLVQAGLDVVMLDRRPVAHGSTVASTGLIQYEIDTPLVELRRLIGGAAADRAYRASLGAVRRLRRIGSALPGGAAFEARASLYLASAAEDAALLREEWTARQELGLAVDYLGAEQLGARYGFDRPAALLSADAGQVDPFLLTSRLVAACASSGARVRIGAGANVLAVESGAGASLVAAGGSVRATSAVFATGYESQSYLDQPVATLRSTYAIATTPETRFPAWAGECVIWETARPYLYLRGAGARMVIGGEDEDLVDPVRRDSLIGPKARRLLERGRELLPALEGEIACAWAGTFAETRDGLPYIGCPADHPHIWFALGYGGNGITFSLLAAEIIRDACTGRANADAELFRFGR